MAVGSIWKESVGGVWHLKEANSVAEWAALMLRNCGVRSQISCVLTTAVAKEVMEDLKRH